MAGTFAGVSIILVLVGIVIAVLWIALPFAVFGVKPLIREQIALSRRTNALLEQLAGGAKAPVEKPYERVPRTG